MSLFREDSSKNEDLYKQIEEFRDIYGDVLDWIIIDLKQPGKLGYCKSFINSFRINTPYIEADDFFSYDKEIIWGDDARQIRKYIDRIKLRKLAYKNLVTWTSKPPTSRMIGMFLAGFKSSEIEYGNFSNIYSFLERIYFLRVNRKLDFKDLLNVYFGGLPECITFALDKFDKITEIPNPTIEFFKKLDKVEYLDKYVEKFVYNSRVIIRMAIELEYGKNGSFGSIESLFLSYIAGCSAVNDNRLKITINDYITAYKTYYKLLKTDVTEYKCKPELFYGIFGGYLFCNSCGGYYKLQSGESPSDFDKCRCGGELEYVDKISNE